MLIRFVSRVAGVDIHLWFAFCLICIYLIVWVLTVGLGCWLGFGIGCCWLICFYVVDTYGLLWETGWAQITPRLGFVLIFVCGLCYMCFGYTRVSLVCWDFG